MQRRLLSEPDLTFKKALELAQAIEAAERNVQELQCTKGGTERVFNVKWSAQNTPNTKCYRCGDNHSATDCRFKGASCHNCGKQGHIARACRSKSKRYAPKFDQTTKGTHQVQSDQTNQSQEQGQGEANDDQVFGEYSLFNVKDIKNSPMQITVCINGAELTMEVDTGATLSIISQRTYERLWDKENAPRINPSKARLRTYTGEIIDILGELVVEVVFGKQRETCSLIVVQGDGPSLLGRDWLKRVKLDWSQLNQIHTSNSLTDILDRYSALFSDELGIVNGVQAKIFIDSDATPRFFRARTVPFALRGKVEEELKRLENQEIIEPVRFADWAAPVVPIVKPDGSIRLCGDYKITANLEARVDTYPLPRIDDLLASLSGGQSFSKLDLAHAYLQIPLEEQSKRYTTINTHRGLFQYNRLPFGLSTAPAIFQRTIESILGDLPRVCIYLDDILVTGANEKEHLGNLEAVLKRLQGAGFRLKRHKCAFLLPSVEYFGSCHFIRRD